MKKQLIQEINRAREIMGLSIIPEQTFDNRRTFAAFYGKPRFERFNKNARNVW